MQANKAHAVRRRQLLRQQVHFNKLARAKTLETQRTSDPRALHPEEKANRFLPTFTNGQRELTPATMVACRQVRPGQNERFLCSLCLCYDEGGESQ